MDTPTLEIWQHQPRDADVYHGTLQKSLKRIRIPQNCTKHSFASLTGISQRINGRRDLEVEVSEVESEL